MDGQDYITDNSIRVESDQLLLPKLMDMGGCFGKSTLAMVYGMDTEDIKEYWKVKKRNKFSTSWAQAIKSHSCSQMFVRTYIRLISSRGLIVLTMQQILQPLFHNDTQNHFNHCEKLMLYSF